MNVRTIRTKDDVRAVIIQALGFEPENSICVIGVGAMVPTARLDISPLFAFLEAMTSAAPHWREKGVVLAAMTDDPEFDLSLYDGALAFLGVEVIASVTFPNPGDGAARRTDMETLASLATTAGEAESLAWQAYRAGNGALAWCYLDRHEELAGGYDEGAATLKERLSGCVHPSDV